MPARSSGNNHEQKRPGTGRWRTNKEELRCRLPPAEDAAEGSFAKPSKTMTDAAQPSWRVFL